MYIKLRGFIVGLLAATLMSMNAISYADDTEIYFARADVDNEENKPTANVMIMLDTSGSMRFCKDEKTTAIWCDDTDKRRINMLEDAIEGILANTPESVNLGLGRFTSGGTGGQVIIPVVPVNDKTKPDFQSALRNINPVGRTIGSGNASDSRSPVGGTPTARAYAEMARYMLGLDPGFSYSNNGPEVTVCDNPNDSECAGFPVKVRTVGSDGRYESPVNTANQCESNHIILFTDGVPSANEKVDLASGAVTCSADETNWWGQVTKNGTPNYTCQQRVASYLNSEENGLGVPVYTHNIGLYMGAATEANMKSVSDAGDGATHDSNSAEELLNAFLSTLDLIDAQSRSISAPGVAVNTMNRFQHLDELYYAVFQPAESSFWEGNLKKYRLEDQEIVGYGASPVIDSETGYFKSDSRSLWSGEVDGADATKGGARANVGTRNLYYSNPPGATEVGATSKLTWANASDSNSTPVNDFFEWSAPPEITRQQMFDTLATMWGDPMHSVPLMVNYGDDGNYVFVSTNGGMLHVIDTSNGSEVAAFMPYELFKKAPQFTSKPGLNLDNTRQLYGLDASWIAWRKPGETLEDEPETVYIYGGMRRGGEHFYALDVTTPSSPRLKWQINRGDEGFEKLGQTWSTPTLIRVPTSDGAVPALIFGGGYSPENHDGPTHTRSDADAMGNTIYIVDAESGDLIWSAEHDHLKWAVPGGVSVVDINFDGVADHLYFGDLGGQLFRVDIDHVTANHSTHRIADLGAGGADAESADHRRFYEAPSVAYVKTGAQNHLYVAAASGYRAHPLDEETSEGLFVVIDKDALYSASPDATLVTLSDMANVVTETMDTGDRGWYYMFEDDSGRAGEKALSSPVIFDNKLLLSTYAPTEQDQEEDNPCAVRYGAAYLHTVELRTGAPTSLIAGAPGPNSRSEQLDQSTPPPTPTLLVDEHGNLVVVVGTEVIGEGNLGDPSLRKRRWMQLSKDEANTVRLAAEGAAEDEEGGGDE